MAFQKTKNINLLSLGFVDGSDNIDVIRSDDVQNFTLTLSHSHHHHHE